MDSIDDHRSILEQINQLSKKVTNNPQNNSISKYAPYLKHQIQSKLSSSQQPRSNIKKGPSPKPQSVPKPDLYHRELNKLNGEKTHIFKQLRRFCDNVRSPTKPTTAAITTSQEKLQSQKYLYASDYNTPPSQQPATRFLGISSPISSPKHKPKTLANSSSQYNVYQSPKTPSTSTTAFHQGSQTSLLSSLNTSGHKYGFIRSSNQQSRSNESRHQSNKRLGISPSMSSVGTKSTINISQHYQSSSGHQQSQQMLAIQQSTPEVKKQKDYLANVKECIAKLQNNEKKINLVESDLRIKNAQADAMVINYVYGNHKDQSKEYVIDLSKKIIESLTTNNKDLQKQLNDKQQSLKLSMESIEFFEKAIAQKLNELQDANTQLRNYEGSHPIQPTITLTNSKGLTDSGIVGGSQIVNKEILRLRGMVEDLQSQVDDLSEKNCDLKIDLNQSEKKLSSLTQQLSVNGVSKKENDKITLKLLEKTKEMEKILLENQKFQDEILEMRSMVERLKRTNERNQEMRSTGGSTTTTAAAGRYASSKQTTPEKYSTAGGDMMRMSHSIKGGISSQLPSAISIVDENNLWRGSQGNQQQQQQQQQYYSAGNSTNNYYNPNQNEFLIPDVSGRSRYTDTAQQQENELLRRALKVVEDKCDEYKKLYEELKAKNVLYNEPMSEQYQLIIEQNNDLVRERRLLNERLEDYQREINSLKGMQNITFAEKDSSTTQFIEKAIKQKKKSNSRPDSISLQPQYNNFVVDEGDSNEVVNDREEDENENQLQPVETRGDHEIADMKALTEQVKVLKEMNDQRGEAIELLQKEKIELVEILDFLQKEEKDFQKTKNRLESEIQNLEKDKNDLLKERYSFENKIKDLQKNHTESISQCKAENRKLSEEIETINSNMEHEKGAQKDYDEIINSLKSQKESLQTELNTLKSQNEKSEKDESSDVLTKLTQENQELYTNLHTLTEQIQDSNTSKIGQEQLINKLKSENAALNKSLEQTTTQLNHEKSAKSSLSDEITQLRTKNQELLQLSNDVSKQFENQTQQLLTVQDSLEKCEEKLTSLQADTQRYKQIASEKEENEEKYHEAITRYNDLEEEKKRLQQILSTKNEQSQNLNQSLHNLKEELQNYKNVIKGTMEGSLYANVIEIGNKFKRDIEGRLSIVIDKFQRMLDELIRGRTLMRNIKKTAFNQIRSWQMKFDDKKNLADYYQEMVAKEEKREQKQLQQQKVMFEKVIEKLREEIDTLKNGEIVDI